MHEKRYRAQHTHTSILFGLLRMLLRGDQIICRSFLCTREYPESNIKRSLSGRRYLDFKCARDFAIVCKTLVHFQINLMASRLFRRTREGKNRPCVNPLRRLISGRRIFGLAQFSNLSELIPLCRHRQPSRAQPPHHPGRYRNSFSSSAPPAVISFRSQPVFRGRPGGGCRSIRTYYSLGRGGPRRIVFRKLTFHPMERGTMLPRRKIH